MELDLSSTSLGVKHRFKNCLNQLSTQLTDQESNVEGMQPLDSVNCQDQLSIFPKISNSAAAQEMVLSNEEVFPSSSSMPVEKPRLNSIKVPKASFSNKDVLPLSSPMPVKSTGSKTITADPIVGNSLSILQTVSSSTNSQIPKVVHQDRSLLSKLQLQISASKFSEEHGPAMFKSQMGTKKIFAFMCIDTGAGGCYLSEKIASKLKEALTKVRCESIHAGGKAMDILGAMVLSFTAGSLTFEETFIIAKGLPVNGLLGNSFNRRHVPLINNEKGFAIFTKGIKKCRVSLFYDSPDIKSSNLLRSTHEYVILPNQSAIIETESDRAGCGDNFRPFRGLVKKNAMSVSQFVPTQIPGQKGRVTICNHTSKYVTIRKGSQLGKFIEPSHDRINLIKWMGKSLYEENPSLNELQESDQEETVEYDWPISNPDLDFENKFEHLDPNQRQRLTDLIHEHRDQFDGRLGLTNLAEHTIKLKQNVEPILLRPYRLSPTERHIEKKFLDLLLEQGVLKPSNSPWGFPNVLVPKKIPSPEDSHRITTNFKRLNEITVRDAYPLPRISDALDSMGGCGFFTSLDANSGFYQIPMCEKDRDKVTMTTHEGLFSYQRMPQGLTNSPLTFQRLMDRVCHDIKWKFCMAYQDDICVFSRTFEEHMRHLKIVLGKLKDAGITLRLKKCKFVQNSLDYLGYVISAKGWEPNPDKVKAINLLSPPRNVSEVRSFLGMMGFFRMFIKNFAKIARPLTDLTKKDVVSVTGTWSNHHQNAFEILRKSLTTAPILKFPDFSKPFILETDASDCQLGAVLMQKENNSIRITGYFSRKLSRAEQNYHTTEKECLAVVWAVTECCRPYLYGREFTVITDHEALRWLLNLKEPRGRLARWALKLMGYNFEVVTRPGRFHSVPDALSRLTRCEDIISFLRNKPKQDYVCPVRRMNPIEDRSGYELPSEEEFRNNYQEDDWCRRILSHFQDSSVNQDRSKMKEFDDYIIENGIIYKLDYLPREHLVLGFRVVVPQNLVKRLIDYYHGALPNGHLGMVKTYNRIRQYYYWRGMQKDVYEYVSLCDTCIRNKSRKPAKQVPLKVIQPTRRFELVALDLLKLNQTYKGNKLVLVITDMFTKFTKTAPLHDAESVTVGEAFVNHWLSIFGAPEKLLSDQGSQFTSELFLALCRIVGVRKIFTTAYHPQTDGVVERNNQTIVKIISMFVATDQKNWDDILSMAVYAHNTSVHSTTGQTPYKMMFGVEAPDLSPEAYRLQLPVSRNKSLGPIKNFQQSLAKAHKFARKAMRKAQDAYKRNYDKNITPKEYKEGELVYLWQPSTKKEGSRKLTAPWRGPFKIKSKINEWNVVLGIPTPKGESTIRVHINRLRKADEKLMEATPLAIGPLHENLPEGHYFIDRLVGERKVNGFSEFKVRWSGWGKRHDTWEPELNLPPIIVNEFRAQIRAKRAQRDASL